MKECFHGFEGPLSFERLPIGKAKCLGITPEKERKVPAATNVMP